MREDIAFNETDLAFNETNLEFNETNHAINETDIALNETNLAFNETDIVFNKTDIAFKETDMEFNNIDFVPAGLNYTFHNMTELDEYCVMEKLNRSKMGIYLVQEAYSYNFFWRSAIGVAISARKKMDGNETKS